MMELTYEQQSFVRECFNRWAWIRYNAMTLEEKQRHSTTMIQVSADIGHSSLLDRLLTRKPIFKYPPPRAMSYPWYSLLEDTVQLPCNAHVHEIVHASEWFNFPHANIEQSIWKIITKNEDGSYICEWTEGHPWQVRLEQMTEEELQGKPWRTMKDWRNWSWKVTLLSDVEYLD